jgi:hypothetical protein
MGEGIWWENPKEKDHLQDRSRWEDGIRMDLSGIGWGAWSGFTLRAMVNVVINLRVLAPRI